jgi:hypothetical protein
LLPPGGFFLHV